MSDFTPISKVTAEDIDHATWKNKDVTQWYKNIPVEVLHNYAIKGGLEEGCDIDILYPYIANTLSLIEVGAAYGRGLRHLLRKGYQGKIYAFDCNENFYQILKTHYSEKAEIILSDIQHFYPPHPVDAILWLWGSISDFSKNEHFPILKHMCTWLNPKGIFILETILHTIKPTNAAVNTDKNCIVSTQYGDTYNYKPSKEEIQTYGEQLKFKYIKHIDYKTPEQRPRILHIFSNHSVC